MLKKGRSFESCLLHDAILSRIISISFITGRNDPVKGIVSQFFPTTVLLFSHLSPISLFFGALYLGWIGSENLGGEFWPVDTGQRRSPQGIPTHPLNPSSRERSRTVVVEKSNHCHWHTALSPLQGMKDILVIFVKDKLWKAFCAEVICAYHRKQAVEGQALPLQAQSDTGKAQFRLLGCFQTKLTYCHFFYRH